jgi:long-chain acyl-CoA synthetase
MPNLATNLLTTAERHADNIALKLDETEIPYSALDAASARVAGLLRGRGLRSGARVGVMLPNVPQFAIVYYGVLRAGCVVVPMNPLLKRREVEFYLSDSEAELMFVWHEFSAAAVEGAAAAGATDAEVVEVIPGAFERLLASVGASEDVTEVGSDDTAVILYTSGTTGTPKGAELTHGNLGRNVEVSLELFTLDSESVVLGALPLFHAFGQTCGLNTSVAVGAMLSLIPRFDASKALAIIERDRVTVFEGVPTMFSAMLHVPDSEKYDTSSLRVCVSGGAAMPVEVMRSFEERFGCIVLEGYGLSETSPVASFNHPDSERKPGSIGTPVDGVEMKVVDDGDGDLPEGQAGEIVIRGHNVMKGYWRRPEATSEAIRDGWFHSGDIGRVDEDGYFFIVDRKKELIIRGGYNVYPREIEEVLYEHPDVREVAVIGISHPELGEEVGAAVALKPGASATEAEIRDYVKANVAAYKYPRHVWFVDELPKGATGKILKREIVPPSPRAEASAQAGP